MTPRSKPDLARGMRRAIELTDERADRLASMSDADFEREMDSLPPPSRVPDLESLLAGAEKKAAERAAPPKVVPLPARTARPRSFPWLIAAALGALALALTLYVEGRELMAIFRGPEAPTIGPLPQDPKEPERRTPTPTPSPADQAEALRVEADRLCDESLWSLCVAKLDAAKKLDPAGEAAPRVQELRAVASGHPPTKGPVPFDPK